MKLHSFALKLLAVTLVSSGASLASGRTQLYQQSESEPIKTYTDSPKPKKIDRGQSSRSWSNVVQGNPIVVPSQPVARSIDTLLPGTIERALISTSVQAFGNSKVPVQARVTDRNGRDIFLIGSASLEPNSKRITIEFEKAIVSGTDEVFELKAHALDNNGTLGLKGNYVSGESKLFTADDLAGLNRSR